MGYDDNLQKVVLFLTQNLNFRFNMPFDEAQILALAPDSSSAKAGKDLAASVAKWKNMGSNTAAIWGECQGSGKDAYKTQIDLQETAFKCSCPSRKFPCKHGIGLYLLFVRQNNLFANTAEPDWVTEWLKKRTAKAVQAAQEQVAPSAEKVEKQAKEKEKRALERKAKVEGGIADLNLLLHDWVRGGILQFQSKPFSFWTQKAARLVDAQAAGLATMLLAFKDINYAAPDWQNRCMQQLAQLNLLANAYRNIEHLPQALQYDVRNLIGWSMKKEEVPADPLAQTISDTWLVCGKIVEENTEQNLSSQYLWLYGQESRRYALLLDFAAYHTKITTLIPPATAQKATLVFYPSAAPLRAFIKEEAHIQPFAYPTHLYENFTEFADIFAGQLRQQPFLDKVPFWIKQLNLTQYQNKMWIYDTTGLYMPLHERFKACYEWLAHSGAAPCDACVLYYQQQIIPLGIWVDRQYITF